MSPSWKAAVSDDRDAGQYAVRAIAAFAVNFNTINAVR